MRNILFLLLLAVLVACGGGSKQEQSTAKQDTIDSAIMKAVERDHLKKKAIEGLTRYLKRQVSSDPDYAEVRGTDDFVSDDSIYFAKARIVVMNRYGAKEQYDDLLFCVCRRDTSHYMIVWPNEEYCLRGVESMSGKHNREECIPTSGFHFHYYRDSIYNEMTHSGFNFHEMETVINE